MTFPVNTRGVSPTRTRGPGQRGNVDTAHPRIGKPTRLPLRHIKSMALDAAGGDLYNVIPDGADR